MKSMKFLTYLWSMALLLPCNFGHQRFLLDNQMKIERNPCPPVAASGGVQEKGRETDKLKTENVEIEMPWKWWFGWLWWFTMESKSVKHPFVVLPLFVLHMKPWPAAKALRLHSKRLTREQICICDTDTSSVVTHEAPKGNTTQPMSSPISMDPKIKTCS